MPRIALLSTSDTDLLSARASAAPTTRWPTRPGWTSTELPALLERRRSGRRADPRRPQDLGGRPGRADRAAGLPIVVLGGEQAPDAALMELSTVPIGVAAEAHALPRPGRRRPTSRSCTPSCPTPCCSPGWVSSRRRRARVGVPGRGTPPAADGQRRWASCSTGRTTRPGTPRTSQALADAVDATGARSRCRSSARRCAPPRPTCSTRCGTLDALVTTVLAAGGTTPGDASRGRGRRGVGRRARWPRSTSRSCRGCA